MTKISNIPPQENTEELSPVRRNMGIPENPEKTGAERRYFSNEDLLYGNLSFVGRKQDKK